ncbi:MAG: hypothetical protein KGJ59_10140, partial [Bacteroidota bacterium]|nr:hypothetical protein [Bacteroidota bacterium]
GEKPQEHYVGWALRYHVNNTIRLALANAISLKPVSYHDCPSEFLFSDMYKDSTSHIDSATVEKSSVILRIASETGMGGLMGVFFALPGGLVGNIISGSNSWDSFGPTLAGMYTGYTFGSALGVYLIANGKKNGISFLGTLTSDIVGAGIGIGINQVSGQKGIGSLAPLILPVVAAIIYVELVE